MHIRRDSGIDTFSLHNLMSYHPSSTTLGKWQWQLVQNPACPTTGCQGEAGMEEECFKLNIFYNNYIIQNNNIIGVSNNIEGKPEMPIIKFVLLNDCDLNPFDENKYEIQIKITITRNNEGKSEISEYYTTTNNSNTWMTLDFGQKYIINWQKKFYCGNVQIICRDKSNKRILNTIQFSVYGETKVYFSSGLLSHYNFIKIYILNREFSELGRCFKESRDKKNYNIFYNEFPQGYNGLIAKYENFDEINDEINNPLNKYPESIIINEIKVAFQNNNKELIIIRINLDQDFYHIACTLNHEEGAHGINILNNSRESIDYEHKNYYGKDCTECINKESPSVEQVETKYFNSRAKYNYDQIKKNLLRYNK